MKLVRKLTDYCSAR